MTSLPAKRRGRRPSPKTVAQQDQILAILRDAEGFPLSTGDIAKQMGTRPFQVTGWCRSCHQTHVCRIEERRVFAEHIRPLLVRMERDEVVERIVIEDHRKHYWRASIARDEADR